MDPGSCEPLVRRLTAGATSAGRAARSRQRSSAGAGYLGGFGRRFHAAAWRQWHDGSLKVQQALATIAERLGQAGGVRGQRAGLRGEVARCTVADPFAVDLDRLADIVDRMTSYQATVDSMVESATPLWSTCMRTGTALPAMLTKTSTSSGRRGRRHDAGTHWRVTNRRWPRPQLLPRCDRGEPEDLGLAAMGDPLRVDPAALGRRICGRGPQQWADRRAERPPTPMTPTPVRTRRAPLSASPTRIRPAPWSRVAKGVNALRHIGYLIQGSATIHPGRRPPPISGWGVTASGAGRTNGIHQAGR